MDSTDLGVVTGGPYRWVRHPNYVAVAAELAAVPLAHTAWLTVAIGGLVDFFLLWRRITIEEEVLLADPLYRASMGHKPRFIPRLTR